MFKIINYFIDSIRFLNHEDCYRRLSSGYFNLGLLKKRELKNREHWIRLANQAPSNSSGRAKHLYWPCDALHPKLVCRHGVGGGDPAGWRPRDQHRGYHRHYPLGRPWGQPSHLDGFCRSHATLSAGNIQKLNYQILTADRRKRAGEKLH